MSPRTEQAAVVATYRAIVADLNQQAAVLHGAALGPIIRFMEAQQQAAEQALRELDAGRWEEQQADAILAARYGDVLAQER